MPQGALHICIHDIDHPTRGFNWAYSASGRSAHFGGKSLKSSHGSRFVQIELATQQSCARKMAKHDVRVRYGRQE